MTAVYSKPSVFMSSGGTMVEKSNKLNEELVRNWTICQPSVAAYISLMIPNFHDAQDILQEVAVAVFARDFTDSPVPNSFKAWALTVARNKVVDYRRRRGTRNLFAVDIIESMAGTFNDISAEENPRRDALEQCLKHISKKAMQLLEMRYRDTQPMEAVATATGQSVAAVRVALHRIRLVLRKCIEKRLSTGEG